MDRFRITQVLWHPQCPNMPFGKFINNARPADGGGRYGDGAGHRPGRSWRNPARDGGTGCGHRRHGCRRCRRSSAATSTRSTTRAVGDPDPYWHRFEHHPRGRLVLRDDPHLHSRGAAMSRNASARSSRVMRRPTMSMSRSSTSLAIRHGDHPAETEFAAKVAARSRAEDLVDANSPREMGSEDFALHARGASGGLPVPRDRPGANGGAGLHHPGFDFNDEGRRLGRVSS